MADSLAVRNTFWHVSGCDICAFISSKIFYRILKRFLTWALWNCSGGRQVQNHLCVIYSTWTSQGLVISLRSNISVAGFGSESQFSLLTCSSQVMFSNHCHGQNFNLKTIIMLNCLVATFFCVHCAFRSQWCYNNRWESVLFLTLTIPNWSSLFRSAGTREMHPCSAGCMATVGMASVFVAILQVVLRTIERATSNT